MSEEKKIRDIVSLITKSMDYISFVRRIPSLSFALTLNDKLILNTSVGYKNLESKEKASPDTLYRISSISKIFTAIAILQLSEKEKLNSR